MNSEIILKQLKNKIDVYCLKETDSTNMYAKIINNPNDFLVTTDIQTNGRGRIGRKWEGSSGEDIFMTVKTTAESIEIISERTLVAGLCVYNVLKRYCPEVKIKWPNDIIIGSKKVCGILCELVSEGNKNKLITGIGVNVNSKKFSHEIRNRATSLHEKTGQIYCLEEIVADIVNNLYSLNGRFKDYKEEYSKNCINLTKDNIINLNGREVCAKGIKVGNEGELTVLAEGKEFNLKFGEVQVKGIYEK